MKTCPICHTEIADSDITCTECLHKAMGMTTALDSRRLFLMARQLALLFAIFLFTKGCWMAFSEESYSHFVQSFGLPKTEPTIHYLSSLFASVSAVLYVVAWIGGIVRAKWNYSVCVAAFAAFVLGQLVTRLAAVGPGFPLPQAIAFIVLWAALPLIQLIGLTIGKDPYAVEAK